MGGVKIIMGSKKGRVSKTFIGKDFAGGIIKPKKKKVRNVIKDIEKIYG